ncbi:hypothetical protein BH10BAC5_BH10BAC5_15300 [soil metagenome]
MKKIIPALALLILLPSILLSQNNWQKTDIGNEGGIVNVLYSDTINQLLYAGSDGKGVFATSNTGASWYDLSLNLPSYALYVKSIVKAGSDLIIGSNYFTISKGVFRTTDNGSSWTNIISNFSGDSCKVNKVHYENSKLYIGTQAGIFVTNYPAITWSNISSNLGLTIQILNIYSTDNLLFVSTNNGVYKSSNNGQSWTNAGAGLPPLNIKSFIKFNNVLYASMFSSGVYASTDLGNSWTAANTNLNSGGENAWSLYRFNNNLYVSTNNGIYVLIGSSWTRVSNNMPVSQNFCYSMSAINGKLFACTYSRGTYCSSDPAAGWTQSLTGLRGNSITVKKIVFQNNVYYAATASGIYSSLNCINWIKSSGDLPPAALKVNDIYTIANELYIVTESGLYHSTNASVNWTNMSGDISSNFFYSFYKDVLKIYAGTRNGLFYSTNNGINWLPTEINTVNNSVDCIIKFNGVFFAGRSVANAPTLFKSTNDGLNWTAVPFNTAFTPEVFSFFVDGISLYLTTGGGIFKTTNTGLNWRNVNHGLPSDPYVSSMIKAGTSFYCSTLFGGLGAYTSSINDSTWGQVNTAGNPLNDYNGLFSVNNKLFALLSGGIYYADLVTITGITTEPENEPVSFLILKNYPNPFNPQTKINYNVITSGNVKMNIYDMTGKLISKLLNENKQKGNYEITFDGSGLNSGIYFVRMENENNLKTLKVILLR